MVEGRTRRLSLIRLAIVVEGPTERSFVGQVLAAHLRPLRIDARPILIGRASGHQGGGSVNVPRLAANMSQLYWSFEVVTSLVDFYGFERKDDATVDMLEKAILDDVKSRIRHSWDGRKVLPYVQKHEFEALLFADVDAFSAINAPPNSIDELRAVPSRFATPEDIDDNPATAPSKRIAAAITNYDKVVAGAMVAKEIGLEAMRSTCPRFAAWLARLESLGGRNA